MEGDDLLGQGQADSRPRPGGRSLHLPVPVEHGLEHVTRKAGAGVLHREENGFRALLDVQGDPAVFRGEFQGVGEKVENDLLELVGIDRQLDFGQGMLEKQADVLLVGQDLDRGEEGFDVIVEFQGFRPEPHPPGFQLVEIQEVVDELEQAVPVAADGIQRFFLKVGDGTHPAQDHRAQRGDHQGQRRPELMVDVGEKLHFHLVEGFQLFV
ncbi:MAG: hypothetical protein BWX98_01710 [Candidatus Aminicenantes bacterium ADurb.Bin147]|nr:MAG: hypothetical protein BWX98_01710 [Candidatus Aminicenantes bacterium ADurb.Bin147]